eukprot:7379128-Prymnesium_polylepis.1
MTGTPRSRQGYVTTNLPATSRTPIKVGERLNYPRDDLDSFRNQVGGIIPGYSGHRPGARDKYGGAAVGNVQPFGGPPRQGSPARQPPPRVQARPGSSSAPLRYFSPESTKWGNNDSHPREVRQYKEEVRGIVPGYAGHIPTARDEVGQTAYGNVPAQA